MVTDHSWIKPKPLRVDKRWHEQTIDYTQEERAMNFIEVLHQRWGSEWEGLTDNQKRLVLDDYSGASYEDRQDYTRNIGNGNLASYARTLEAGDK